MLRLTPTVISLTMAEVREVENRRRFQKFLAAQPPVTQPDPVAREASQEPVNRAGKSARLSAEAGYDKQKEAIISRSRERLRAIDPPNESTSEQRREEILPLPELPRRRDMRQDMSDGPADGLDSIAMSSSARRLSLTPRRLAPAEMSVSPGREPDTSDLDSTPTPRQTREQTRARYGLSTPSGRTAVPDPVNVPEDWVHSDPVHQVPGQEVSTPDRQSFLRRAESLRSLAHLREAEGSSMRFYHALRDERHDPPIQPIPQGSPRSSPLSMPRSPAGFQIYDDSLPASSQPQTPQNLPETRHQSRLSGSYTVPARRLPPYPLGTPTTGRLRRRARGRHLSPPGLQTPGFRGLYGGIENTDDSVLFEQASRELDSGGSHAEPPPSPRIT
ncbi:hypothetical protein B0T24DRAFT_621632 [Lasiosphaeria ovina]|uniref:Uncharacterized protein n=1 Tax=Lasiosphaeria ovina TaxID=92902 RepID=A0AAE0N6S3_9PEZI|nr:hypothetical protein B0T24DRAFT_621632 [Lasiosphaeria ovina]